MTTVEQQIAYYAQPGVMTDPRGWANQLAALPRELPELVRTLQTLYVHIFWLKAYGLEISEERKNAEVNLRPVHRRLERMLELDPAPLSQPRSPPSTSMPSMSGRPRSSTMTSGRCSAAAFSAAAPLAAVITS